MRLVAINTRDELLLIAILHSQFPSGLVKHPFFKYKETVFSFPGIWGIKVKIFRRSVSQVRGTLQNYVTWALSLKKTSMSNLLK